MPKQLYAATVWYGAWDAYEGIMFLSESKDECIRWAKERNEATEQHTCVARVPLGEEFVIEKNAYEWDSYDAKKFETFTEASFKEHQEKKGRCFCEACCFWAKYHGLVRRRDEDRKLIWKTK